MNKNEDILLKRVITWGVFLNNESFIASHSEQTNDLFSMKQKWNSGGRGSKLCVLCSKKRNCCVLMAVLLR